MKIGYARATRSGPSVEDQILYLRNAGAEAHIWQDDALREWTQRDFAVKACREGDELIVCSLWLLGRSRADLEEAIKKAIRLGAVIRCLDGGTLVSVEGMAVLAEISLAETAYKRERITPASKKKKARGIKGGRKPLLTDDQIREAIKWQEDEDLSYSQIAQRLAERGVTMDRSSIYNAIKRYLAGQPATT